jgi:hypothetical protein
LTAHPKNKVDISKYIKKLKAIGLSEKGNISDFWFTNKNEIATNNKFIDGTDSLDEISLIIRWKSEIGQKCQTELLKFIEQKQAENITARNESYKKGVISFSFADINFYDFKFHFNETEHNIATYSKLFDTSQISGFCDLRGIEMANIKITDSALRNGCFSTSNFSNTNLQHLQFDNMNFVKANFSNSRLANIGFQNNSTITGANLTNAFINAISFTDQILGDGITYKPITYFQLLQKAIGKATKNRNHTEFLFVDTKAITNYELHNLKRYSEWYMKVSRLIRDSKFNIKKKISTFLQILISKYWTSYTVFGGITIITILLLSTVFNLTSGNFKTPAEIQPIDFIDSIYFVIVTFTTLGYGDISPINHYGQCFVILTALTGYLFLAIFIYLLSKKIED